MSGAPTPTGAWRAPLAAAAYLLIALAAFAPLLPHFGDALLGGPIAANDGFFHVWHIWWAWRALSAGQSPFFTPLLFHPYGIELYLQPITLSNGVLALPVTASFGPVAGFNAVALLAFALAGAAGFALALRVSGSAAGAFVGGLAFAFAPFHMTRQWDGQLELVALQWLGFYALFALRAAEERRPRDALLAGLMLAVTGYTAWYYFLFALVYSAAFALLWLRRPWGPYLRQWLIVGSSGALLVAPALVPGLLSLLRADRTLAPVDPAELRTFSANLLDFWLPTYLHPLWGEAVSAAAGGRWHQLSADWNVALGYGVLALAAIGCAADWGRAWRWAALTAVSLAFALGPELQVGPWDTGLPLPYALLAALPGADFGRRPLHFTALAALTLAPLAALGVRALLARAPAPARPWARAAVLAALAFELLPVRWSLHSAAVSPYYATIGAHDGAVLHVPLPAYKRIAAQKAQLVHGAPIFGGFVARMPPYDLSRPPGLGPLFSAAPSDERMLSAGPDEPLVGLRAFDVRHVIVNWDQLKPGQRPEVEAAVAQALPGLAPAYADGSMTAYIVPDVALRPFAYFGEGWYPEEAEGARRWRWMLGRGAIVLANPRPAPAVARLSLALESNARPRELALAMGGDALASWPVRPQPETTRRTLHLLLPPGEQRLDLVAPLDPALDTVDGRPIGLVVTAAALEWEAPGE